MRIYKNDVVKVTVVSAEGKLLAPSVEDSGFTSLAGVISYAECSLHIEGKRLSEQKKNLILMVLK